MAATLFTRLRKSYFTQLLFSSILSNLVLFGQPIQQLIYGNTNKKVLHISAEAPPAVADQKGIPQRPGLSEKPAFNPLQYESNFKEISIYYAQEAQAVIGVDSLSGVENPLDNFFTIILPADVNPREYDVVMSYALKGLSDPQQTTKRINNQAAYGGLEVSLSENWADVSEIIPAHYLHAGRNEIHFNRREEQRYRYSIKNLTIEFRQKNNADIAINNEIFLSPKGSFATTAIIYNDAITEIEVLGKHIPVKQGIAEILLENVPADIKDVKFEYVVGSETKAIVIPITNSFSQTAYTFGHEAKENISNGVFTEDTPESALTLSSIPEYLTVSEVRVSGLSFKDIKALNDEIEVVTSGQYIGFRVEREHFPDSIGTGISLKYDPTKIPEGYTEKDVQTFYYDGMQRMWKVLPVDSLDIAKHEIRSTTYINDTDYINGVIKVPDSPETSSFAPTAMNDIKFADPAAGIVSLQPPTPNSTGSASTGFPLKLPAGRNGMQPSLLVSYNSEAGNSWMGIGWNLSTPAISINTKWGVPTYDGTYESELYSLNGADLVLLNEGQYTSPQKTPNIARQAERLFYERKEGAYNMIKRFGNNPSNYFWVVTDKMGNKSYYGGYGSVVDGAVIRTGGLSTGNIAHWALYRTEDTYGNYVEYTYSKGTQVVNGVTSQYFYISQIDYTLKGATNTNFYRVKFIRNDTRQDITTSARLGMMQLTQSLLSEVQVFYVENSSTENLIRKYGFTYYTNSETAFSNPFKKSVLKSISEYDSAGLLFYSHTMEYYNDLTGNNIVNNSDPKTWNGSEDNVSPVGILSGLNLGTEGSALGTSTSIGGTGGIRVGGGLGFNVLSTSATLAGSGSYSYNENNTKISFIDINGDGLPDKVFKDDDVIKYRPNLGLVNGIGQFGDLIVVSGLNSIGKTKTNTVGYGGDLNLGVVGIGKSGSDSWSQTDDYFTDFNGDGLPDMVTGGQVKFNSTSGNNSDNRSFTVFSSYTENEIAPGQMSTQVLSTMDLPTEAELRADYAQFDHVKVWEAPYTGTVAISGNAVLSQVNTCGGANSSDFRLTIEKKYKVNGEWITTLIQPNDPFNLASGSASMNVATQEVKKGDLLFFRVHNKQYGCGGKVQWNPQVAYHFNQSTVYYNGSDENGKNVINYKFAEDFMLNNGGTTDVGSAEVTLNVDFNLIGTSLSALNLSDEVRFNIQRIRYNTQDNNDEPITTTFQRIFTPGTGLSGNSGNNTFSIAMNSGLAANSSFRDVLYCFIESDSNVDWTLLKWKPTYTVSGNTEIKYPNVSYLTYDNNVAQKKYWISYYDFATPVIDSNITNDGLAPFMVLSHDFDQVDWQHFLNLSNPGDTENPARRKVSWLVKKKTSSGTTILHKKTFYLNWSGNSFSLSRNADGTQQLIAGVGDYDSYFKRTLTKQEVKDIKDENAYVFTAFYIENALVGGNVEDEDINPATITLSLDTSMVSNPLYTNYEPVELESPFWAQSPQVWGYSYRGWGQFMYNGGINPDDQSDYGLTPITADLFDIDTQSGTAQDIGNADPNTSPDDVEAMSPGLTVRYAFYQQLNGQNLYTLPLIKYRTNTGDVDVTFGPDTQNNLYATIGRFGIGDIYSQFIDINAISTGGGGVTFVGLKQYSESHGSANSANGGLPGISGAGTLSTGTSKLSNQYIDFNGDRYPDLVTPGAIQFTAMTGGLMQNKQLIDPIVHSSGSRSEEKTFGASISGLFPNSTKGDNGVRVFKGTNTQANSGINDTEGESKNSKQWLDINGDGLTDRVSLDTDGNRVVVNLNTGYGFSVTETNWISDLNSMEISSNSGGSVSISGGTAWPSMSYALGLGTAQSTSNVETSFLDVNGDGLPDLVIRNGNGYKYHLNTGTGFSTGSSDFYDSNIADQDHTISGNFFGSYTWGFAIPIPFLGIAIKTTTTPSVSTTAAFSEKRHTFQDIDGDGLVDVVHQIGNNNGSVRANLNSVGKTYLLKKVNLALGGSWSVEYTRSINGYNMPNSKWLLTKVTTHDGFTGDDDFRPSTTLTTAKYEEPNYSRREREFLGYAKVTTEQRYPDAGQALFRYVEEYYHNENIYLTGAKKGSATFDASGNPLAAENTLFNLLDPDDPTVNFNASASNNFLQTTMLPNDEQLLDRSRLFIAVARVSSTTYEGQGSLTAVKEFLSYDEFGNLLTYRDLGEGEEDTYKTVIEYHPSNYFSIQNATGFPKKISVYKNLGNVLMRERQAIYYTGNGGLYEITTKLNSTEDNKVSLEYDTYGNLTKVNDLENKNAANTGYYSKEITYDTVLNMFPIKIKNSFQEESSMLNYNYLFGVPMFVQDVNGQQMRTRIDNRGRVVEVTGPNEMAVNVNAWTIRMEYKGENAITSNIATTTHVIPAQGSFSAVLPGSPTPTDKQHWAVTRHFDPENAVGYGTNTNQLLTITIADGFGQAIQVKKTHKGLGPTETSESMKWMVSGFDQADDFGRVITSRLPAKQSGYPTGNLYSLTGSLTYFAPTSVPPTLSTTEYDVKDRPVNVTQVDETDQAVMEYTIEGNRFVQKLLNENNGSEQTLNTYTDIRGRQRKTVQNDEITTKFEYNVINELLKVIDNDNFETKYKYDLAGRKVEMAHPDRGVITFKYDKASRMTEQSNSNLIALNQKINYYYDCGRLVRIAYPQNVQNEVKYTYGAYNDALAIEQNAVGRLLYQEDATGVQVFGYGKMGEVTKNLRSVAVAGYQSYWFYTKWKYDSWNRIKEITYPDQEVVTYHYNEAGALNSIDSEMDGISNVQPIVQEIKYTDYGERASIKHGNNTVTNYSYDTRRRMNTLAHVFTNFNISKTYEYDALSNITKIQTNTPQNSLPGTGKIGGPIYHEYEYDNYNRLVSAEGHYTGPNDLTTPYLFTNYSLKMSYNTDHTIKKKIQRQTLGSVTSYGGTVSDSRPVEKTSYVLDYSGYGNGQFVTDTNGDPNSPDNYGYQQPHAPRTITESPSWVSNLQPDDPRIRQKKINYDANGNQTEISETVGTLTTSLRKNLWDEENRLKAVNLKPDDHTGHPIAIYTYDAGGARTVRYNYDRMDASVNANELEQGYKDNVMIYPSGLMMGKAIPEIRKNGEPTGNNTLAYTKHYYIGAERISAKTGTLASFGGYPQQILSTTGEMTALTASTVQQPTNATVTTAMAEVIAVSTSFGTPITPANPVGISNITYNTHQEGMLNIYYFHPDHLGSSSYITNSAGVVSQHMEYLPFGETLVDEHLNSNNSPFKYNGKEFDEETGNYYYGARYYDPKLSIFISVDPLADKYAGVSPYAYCFNNPIKLIDPTGMEPNEPSETSGTPKKNIIITINDGGLPHKPATWDTEAWHHITVDDISEANDILKKYLGDTKADNIFLISHGGPANSSGIERYIEIGIDNNITHDDLNAYFDGQDESASAQPINTKGINDLKTLSNYVKDGGNFIFSSCTAGSDSSIGSNISKLFDNKLNTYFNNNFCKIPNSYKGDNHRDDRLIFIKAIQGPWDKYESKTGNLSTVQSIELMKNDKINPIKFRK